MKKKLVAIFILSLAIGAEIASFFPTLNRYEHAQKSTVLVKTSHGYGTGFVVQRGNRLFVFTAAHVVTQENTVAIQQVLRYENVKVGESHFSATVIARDEFLDVAILWLHANPANFEPARFATHEPKVGTPVFHIGNFSGIRFDNSVSAGILSQIGVAPNMLGWPWPVADQTTATIVPGSSGGALFDSRGHVIGLAVGHLVPGIEFYVPLRAIVASAFSHNVSWTVAGTVCPPDSTLNALARHAAYVEPVPVLPLLLLPEAPHKHTVK